MPASTSDAARKLRSAVLAGDHTRASELVAEYVGDFERVWLSLPERERASSPLPQQARELLAWARQMTIIHRARTAGRLAVVEKAILYQPASLPRPQSGAVQVRI